MIDCEWNDDYCDKCEMDYYDIIDHLIKDIQHLEAKVVYLRYLLSGFLPKHDRDMLRCDIFHDLARAFWELPAYRRYVSKYCDGHDPIDDDSYVALLTRISTGEESTRL